MNNRGLSRVELLALVFCAAMGGIVVWFLLNTLSVNRTNRRQQLDRSQITDIFKSWTTFASAFNGLFPTPGLIDRLPVNGQEQPGAGYEDMSRNTTANLFSACIIQNYITPQMCVGPTEPSDHVKVKDYDKYAYQPVTNLYWDTTYGANLHGVSNVSYAHMPLAWTDSRRRWRNTVDATAPILGNRGPLGGVTNPKSITNRIHVPRDRWTGYICFGDGHTEAMTALPTRPHASGAVLISPESYLGGAQVPPATDALITFTKKVDVADRPDGGQIVRDIIIQHD